MQLGKVCNSQVGLLLMDTRNYVEDHVNWLVLSGPDDTSPASVAHGP
jgi:hypothetical protein